MKFLFVSLKFHWAKSFKDPTFFIFMDERETIRSNVEQENRNSLEGKGVEKMKTEELYVGLRLTEAVLGESYSYSVQCL